MNLKEARAAVSWFVGRHHVGETVEEVTEAILKRAKKAVLAEHGAILREAIEAEHLANRALYVQVMSGRLGDLDEDARLDAEQDRREENAS